MRTLRSLLALIVFVCLPTLAPAEVVTYDEPHPYAVILDLSTKDMGYPYAPHTEWALQFITPHTAYEISSFRIYLGNYSTGGRGADTLKVVLTDKLGSNLFTSSETLKEYSNISFVDFAPKISVDPDSSYFINLHGDGEVVAWLVTSAVNAFTLANKANFGSYGFRSQFALNGSSLPAASSAPNPPSPPSPVPDPMVWSLMLIGCVVAGIALRTSRQGNCRQSATC